MLTINADGPSVYQRFHTPGDEKRMIVILDPRDYEWLTCTPEEANSYFKQWREPLDSYEAPLPPHTRKPK